MSDFTKPTGINIRNKSVLSAPELVDALCRIAGFLQNIKPYNNLQRYDDWWEHDGLHFLKAEIDFHMLFNMVRSPKSLLHAMPGDDDVCVGIAPNDNSWYLRFYIEWDDEGFNLLGKFDITLPNQLSEIFRDEIARQLDMEIIEQDAQSYYQSIIRKAWGQTP